MISLIKDLGYCDDSGSYKYEVHDSSYGIIIIESSDIKYLPGHLIEYYINLGNLGPKILLEMFLYDYRSYKTTKIKCPYYEDWLHSIIANNVKVFSHFGLLDNIHCTLNIFERAQWLGQIE